jgi:hypothetical protein
MVTGVVDRPRRGRRLPAMPSLGQRGTAGAQRRARPGPLVVAALTLATALVAGCERKPVPVPEVDSVVVAVPVPDSVVPVAPPAPTSTWNAEAGLALVVAGDDGDARVVVPGTGAGSPADTAAGRADAVLPGEVLLLSRAGIAGRARAQADAATSRAACPGARLGPASGADALPAWTVGLVLPAGAGSPTVRPLPLDSLTGLASGDSAALAAGVTRVASTLPVPAGADGRRLRGLPFVVRSAVRLRADDATHAVAAVLTRSLPQEADPVGEMILLVAERAASAAPTARWSLAYHERAVGHEESLPSSEVLAALRIGSAARAALVVAHAGEEGSRYTLLERTAPGRWRARWTSVARGCGGER